MGLILGAILPNLAGVLLAGAIASGLCAAYATVESAIRGNSIDREMLIGGATVGLALAAFGGLLAAAGAPVFR